MINNSVREVLQKVCATLNKYNVDYLIVGGVAVGFYGYQRISGIALIKPEMKTDLDFWYNPTNENFINLIKALKDLGVNTGELEKIIFVPKTTFLKIPHKFFHTDFLPQMAGLKSFRKCKMKATKRILDGNELYIISYSDLILNKNEVNRNTDKADIVALKRKNKEH